MTNNPENNPTAFGSAAPSFFENVNQSPGPTPPQSPRTGGMEQRFYNVERQVGKLNEEVGTIKRAIDKTNADFGQAHSIVQHEMVKLSGEIEAKFQIECVKVDSIVSEAKTEFEKIRAEVNQARIDAGHADHKQTNHHETIMKVVKDAKAEFDNIKVGVNQTQHDLQILYNEVKHELNGMKAQMNSLQQESPTSDRKPGKHGPSIVPLKELKPSTFDGTAEKWRQWIDEVKDYAEACHPGARSILEKVERLRSEDADEYWLLKQEETQGFNAKGFINDIFLLLKTYTTAASTARSVVMNTRSGYGTLAWQNLFRHFQPALAAREATAYADVMGMISKRAKTLSEMRKLMVELEDKVRICRELCGLEVEKHTLRSVLVGMLDPETRRHTVSEQGMDSSYEVLKDAVLRHINHNDNSTAMDIGALQEGEEQRGWEEGGYSGDFNDVAAKAKARGSSASTAGAMGT